MTTAKVCDGATTRDILRACSFFFIVLRCLLPSARSDLPPSAHPLSLSLSLAVSFSEIVIPLL